MPATTKAQTAKIAAAETFTDAEGDSGQLAQVLAALTGLITKFAGVETTVHRDLGDVFDVGGQCGVECHSHG